MVTLHAPCPELGFIVEVRVRVLVGAANVLEYHGWCINLTRTSPVKGARGW